MPHGYTLDGGWPDRAHILGVDPDPVRAVLPIPPAWRLTPQVTTSIWTTLEASMGARLWTAAAQLPSHAPLSPCLFAARCCPNLASALHRWSAYLVAMDAPLQTSVTLDASSLSVTQTWVAGWTPPAGLVVAELASMVHLARIATGQPVLPQLVSCVELPAERAELEAFLGVSLTEGATAEVRFASEIATQPFAPIPDTEWPDLGHHSREVADDASTPLQLRAEFLRTLPTGVHHVDAIASSLSTTKRTLQRRLKNHGTSFQGVLDGVRRDLAMHYLQHTRISIPEVAFLLAFADDSSFYRAFGRATGTTPQTARRRGTTPTT